MGARQKIPAGWARDPNSKALVFQEPDSVSDRLDRLERLMADLRARLDQIEHKDAKS
jgi:hypothetical protein